MGDGSKGGLELKAEGLIRHRRAKNLLIVLEELTRGASMDNGRVKGRGYYIIMLV